MKRVDKTLIFLTVISGVALAAFCIVFLVPWHDTQERDLSPRLTLIERHNIRLPLLLGERHLQEQTLRFDGRTVWSARIRTPREFGEGFHVSPSGKLVAIEHWLHSRPMVILNVETAAEMPIRAPDELKSYVHTYVYPFSFKRWADDSSSVIVEVERSGGQRETWRVNLETGEATKQ